MTRWHRPGHVECWADESDEEEPPGIASVSKDAEAPGETGKTRRKVTFCDVVKRHYVPAYSVIYGRHPSTFHLGATGIMIDIKNDDCGQILKMQLHV